MLVWNEADVISCLEVLPEVGEDETAHAFTVARDGLRLEITIFQYDGDVAISLFRDGVADPVFDVTLLGCQGIRLVKDPAAEHLEFAPAKCLGGRYDGESPPSCGIFVSVRPSIRLRLFSHAA